MCRGCGAPTQPRKGDAYEYCKLCHPGAIATEWTPARIRDAMRAWQTRHGRLPSSYDWSRTHARRRGGQAVDRLDEGGWPPASVVGDVYGSWEAARAAGSAVRTEPVRRTLLRWTRTQLPSNTYVTSVIRSSGIAERNGCVRPALLPVSARTLRGDVAVASAHTAPEGMAAPGQARDGVGMTLDAQEQRCSEIADSRAVLAEEPTPPRWYFRAKGVLIGVAIASPAVPWGPYTVAPACALAAGLLLPLASGYASALSETSVPLGRPLLWLISLVLVAVGLFLAGLVLRDVWGWVGPVLAGIVAVPVLIVGGGRYDAAVRADMRGCA